MKTTKTSSPVTPEFLLEGFAYTLKQCGYLLRDAKILYRSGSYPDAVICFLALSTFQEMQMDKGSENFTISKLASLGFQMSVDPLFRSLSKLAKEHGGVIDPDEMAQHFLRTLSSVSMKGYDPIQSIVISFGGIAGALAFLKTAKQLLKAWIGRMGVETVTIRADGISIEIKGSLNIQQALDAFCAVSNEVNKRKTSVDLTTKVTKRAISTKHKGKNPTKSADGDDATTAAVTPKATKVANRRQRQSRKRR